MYQIIRYPVGVATDMTIDLTKLSITDGCHEQTRLQKEGHNLLAIVYEREKMAEIRPLLHKIADNPHCLEVFYFPGKRGLIAKRTDGKLFEFHIVKK